MKNIRPIIAIMLSLFLSWQTIAQQVIPTAGDYFEKETFSLSSTFGESFTETLSSDEFILTQGFQQPWNFTYSQLINIPFGWSGISGFIDPYNNNIENLFMDELNHLVFLSNLSGFYYPSQNINTLNEWDYSSGYKAKASQSFNINLRGMRHKDFALELESGWSIIPVLSGCNVLVTDVFDEYSGVRVIKEIGGSKLYWPDFNINTLGVLQPGKAYFALLNQNSTLVFPQCAKSSREVPQDNNNKIEITAWNTPVHTGQSHLILLPAEFLNKLELQTGDALGGFTSSGLCCGVAAITELNQNHCLTIYGDDPFTPEKDGFAEGEPILLRQFQTQKGLEKNLDIAFDPAFPNQGNFAGNGISALKMGETTIETIENAGGLAFNLFPNPTKESITISWDEDWMGNTELSVYNAFGQEVKRYVYHAKQAGKQKHTLAVSDLAPGSYHIFLKLRQQTGVRQFIKIAD